MAAHSTSLVNMYMSTALDSANKRPHTEVSEDSIEEEKSVSEKLNEVNSKLNAFAELFDKLFIEIKNITTTMQHIQVKVDKQEEVLSSVNKKVQDHVKEIKDLKATVTDIKKQLKHNENKMRDQEKKTIDLEARSRRNNLLFFNIPECEGRENCFDVIRDVIKKDFGQQGEFPLHRAHRMGGPRRNAIGRRSQAPRPIIVAFVDHRDRETVRRARYKLKSKISVAEDFPAPIRKARESLLPELRAAKEAKRQATIAYPAKLIIDGHVEKDLDICNFV